MSELLTQADIEILRPLTTTNRNIVRIRGEWVGIFSALRMLLDHDAELRVQLAQVTAHLEAQRVATYQAVEREHAAKSTLAERDARIAEMEQALRAIAYHTDHTAACDVNPKDILRTCEHALEEGQ